MSDFSENVKRQADIVKIVEGYIRLRKAGAQNYSGLCPFHKEKTGSFNVNAPRQFFYCFGCQATGDVFTFVGRMENVSFPEAVRIVAQKCGIPLPKREFSSPEEAAESRLRGKLLDLHEAATAWFEEQLRGPEGALAREYLAGRGLSDEGIRKFRIGYAPDGFNGLRDRLKSMADEETLRASGLFSAKETGTGPDGQPQFGPLYDRFRKRITFPIANESGRVIGFTARTLETGDKAGPKYLNSPETALYTKSLVLFNLDKAKTAIRQAEFALLVEGQMDCISVYLRGIQNVIATSGTAFTEQQVAMLKRHTSNAVVNFDPDTAGANASEKSIALLTEEGFSIRIVTLDGGLDPDRYIRERGVEAYMAAVRGARRQSDYLIDRARQTFPGVSAEQKIKQMNFLLPHIKRQPEELARLQFAEDASQKLGIDSAVMRKDLRQAALKRRDQVEVRDLGIKDSDRILIRAIMKDAEGDEGPGKLVQLAVSAHPEWFEALVTFPALKAMATELVSFTQIEDPVQRDLVARIITEANQVPDYNAEDMRDKRAALAERRRLHGEDARPLAEAKAPTTELVDRVVHGLHHEFLERKHRDLMIEIDRAERMGDLQLAIDLAQEKLKINKEISLFSGHK